jgi:hypothetical protein
MDKEAIPQVLMNKVRRVYKMHAPLLPEGAQQAYGQQVAAAAAGVQQADTLATKAGASLRAAKAVGLIQEELNEGKIKAIAHESTVPGSPGVSPRAAVRFVAGNWVS